MPSIFSVTTSWRLTHSSETVWYSSADCAAKRMGSEWWRSYYQRQDLFYAAYTGFKRRGGAALASVVTLPTPAMKRGDFSEWLDTSKTGASSPIVIYDPTTTRPDGAGGSVRDPFPGNIIPNNRISRVAGLVVGDVPNPDFGGLNQNWVSRASSP